MHLLYIIIGAILGVVVGCFFPNFGVKVGILGDLFLNALKMMVLPIIVTSIIVAITNLGSSKSLGSLGVKTFAYYFVTTGIAVVIGIFIVNIMQPGVGASGFTGELPDRIKDKEAFSIIDVIVGMIHPNLFKAASDFKILPMIVFSIIFGLSIIHLKERAVVVREFFVSLNEVVMQIAIWIINFTPIGVFGLIAKKLGATGGGSAVLDLILNLVKYFFSVLIGLGIHGLIALPIIFMIFTKQNPIKYFVNMSKALMTAFATASSSATLPVTLECTTQQANVSRKTSSVVLPLGATVNMDGTALYEAVAAIFIAQSYGISLGVSDQLVIVLTATLASIGAAGIPEAGLVTMILVLQSVGLPVEGIGLILAIDWLLDRFRTTVNVWGDSIGASVVDTLEGKKIE